MKYIPQVGDKAFLLNSIHDYVVIKGFYGDKVWGENENGVDFIGLTDSFEFRPYKTDAECAEDMLLTLWKSSEYSSAEILAFIKENKDLVLAMLGVEDD
jgi:hypothetical protein